MWNRKQMISGAAMLVVVAASFVFSSAAGAQALTWGGIVSGMPSCVSRQILLSEDLVCVARGTDNDLYSIQINPRTGATAGYRTIGYTRSLVGNPSCTASSAPFVACAVRGQLNELYGIIFNPETLENTGLQRLDQSGDYRPMAGDPSCVGGGSVTDNVKLGRPWVSCGVRGADNRLHAARFLGNAQGISQSSIERADPDEVIVGDPSCAFSGLTICVARSTDSSLAVIAWRSDFSRPDFQVNRLAGPTPFALGNPSCASTSVHTPFLPAGGYVLSASSMVTCGVRGTDSALYLIRFGIRDSQIFASFANEKAFGSGLLAYQSLGGIITNDPSCASTRSQVVTCGVRGTDGYLYLIDVDSETGSEPLPRSADRYPRRCGLCGVFSFRKKCRVCRPGPEERAGDPASVRPPL